MKREREKKLLTQVLRISFVTRALIPDSHNVMAPAVRVSFTQNIRKNEGLVRSNHGPKDKNLT